MSVPLQERAEQIQSIMREFELDARIVARKKSQVVYLKEGSQIVEFLGLVEAGISLMDLENIRIRKEISNNINRKVNCETANIGKTVSAAVKQIEDIRYIETHVGFSQLTEELEETAVCRSALSGGYSERTGGDDESAGGEIRSESQTSETGKNR